MKPASGDFAEPVKVAITTRTEGATIRYTTDGTMPGGLNGVKYEEPILVSKTTCLRCIAEKEGIAASPESYAVYQVGKPEERWRTLHVGNSLTNSTTRMPLFASTLGIKDEYRSFLHGGATTKILWNDATGPRKEEWKKKLEDFSNIDHFTLQPRDFNIEEEADYDQRFLDVVRKRAPSVTPWLYTEWVEFNRKRPTDLGNQPTSQMAKVWPALTWEESMAAMVLYVEDLQKKLADQDKEHRPPRIIPSALAMAWIHRLIEEGEVPGMPPGTFYEHLFLDAVHPNAEGSYLVDLTWICAFSGHPSKGAAPLGTSLTAEQARIMQDLSFDVIENYPASGWYKEGSKEVAAPQVKSANANEDGDITIVKLKSETPGAWFRYTLDGTEPTRTRGYVYCGLISLRKEMTLKAIAYKSGMADSAVKILTPGPLYDAR
jgi:hypothetical protein